MNDRTTKIKICGIKDIQTVEALNIAGADFAGFMFYPKSRRFISAEDAVGLKKELSASIKTVGVFVDAEPEEMPKKKRFIRNMILEETPIAETTTFPSPVTIAVSISWAHETRSC